MLTIQKTSDYQVQPEQPGSPVITVLLYVASAIAVLIGVFYFLLAEVDHEAGALQVTVEFIITALAFFAAAYALRKLQLIESHLAMIGRITLDRGRS